MSVLSTIGSFMAANGGPVAFAVLTAQIIGRAIPDNKKGILGAVRKAAKVIGLYRTPEIDHLTREVEAIGRATSGNVVRFEEPEPPKPSIGRPRRKGDN